jgi:UDP-glucuronate 4-epimerase
VQRLLKYGHMVVGFDNLNSYYDVTLKDSRLTILEKMENFVFVRGSLEDRTSVEKLFQQEQFDYVVNLAAKLVSAIRFKILMPISTVICPGL